MAKVDSSGQATEVASKYRAALGSDAPSSTDELGAHARVADSMDRLIAQSDGGKTIALEGKWGSGKSSVIRMLAEKCSYRNTLVYQYDAWVHAGDPLRRAFLASLIDFLTEAKWLSDVAKWRAELDLLAGKRRESEKTTSPLLTKFGFFLAASLLLLPGGIYCLGKGVEQIIKTGSIYIERWPLFLFWLGAFLFLLPISLCLGNIAYCWARKVPRPDYLAVLMNKQTTMERTSTVENGDQSTIEFQRIFGKLIAASLGVDVTRKLVLVIDNLDRIDAGDVSNIWSLLQSFIDIPSFAKEPWYSRLWVIVPIATEVEGVNVPVNGAKQFDAAFLDKIFQARFRLPPPILKKWRPYLDKLIRKSLFGLPGEEIEKVADVFLASLGSSGLPTPRELVLFVNQLAIFAEQWGDRYPMHAGAAYILEKVDTNLPKLVSGELPSAVIQRITSIDLRTAYSCIYFNTGDEADALDLLQRPLAIRLLTERNVLQLAKSLSQHQGFVYVLQNILGERWGQASPRPLDEAISEFECVASTLEDDVLAQASKKDAVVAAHVATLASNLVRDLSSFIQQHGPDLWLTYGFGRLLALLLRDPSEKILVETVIAYMLGPPLDVESRHLLADGKIQGYYRENTSLVLSIDVVRGAFLASNEVAQLELSGAGFAKFINDLEREDSRILTKLMPAGGLAGAVLYISNEILAGEFSEVDVSVMHWLLAHGTGVADITLRGLASYHSKEADTSGEYATLVADAALSCMHGGAILAEATFDADVASALGELLTSLLSDGEYKAASSIAVLMIASWSTGATESPRSFFQSLSLLSFLDNPDAVPELVTEIRLRLDVLSWHEWIFERAIDLPEIRPLFFQVFRSMDPLRPWLVRVETNRLLVAVNAISERGGSQADRLYDYAIRTRCETSSPTEFFRQVESTRYAWRWFSRGLIALSERSELELLSSLIIPKLEAVSRDDWLQSSTIFTWRERAAIEVAKVSRGFQLAAPADLVRHHLTSLASQKRPIAWSLSLILSFGSLLRKSSRYQIAREEVERIKSAVIAFGNEYWMAAGPLLDRWLLTAQGSTVLPMLAHAIVEGSDPDAVRWLSASANESASFQKFLLDKEFRRDLHQRLRLAIQTHSKNELLVASLSDLKKAIAQHVRVTGHGRRKTR